MDRQNNSCMDYVTDSKVGQKYFNRSPETTDLSNDSNHQNIERHSQNTNRQHRCYIGWVVEGITTGCHGNVINRCWKNKQYIILE